jgi:hypothetical protein
MFVVAASRTCHSYKTLLPCMHELCCSPHARRRSRCSSDERPRQFSFVLSPEYGAFWSISIGASPWRERSHDRSGVEAGGSSISLDRSRALRLRELRDLVYLTWLSWALIYMGGGGVRWSSPCRRRWASPAGTQRRDARGLHRQAP